MRHDKSVPVQTHCRLNIMILVYKACLCEQGGMQQEVEGRVPVSVPPLHTHNSSPAHSQLQHSLQVLAPWVPLQGNRHVICSTHSLGKKKINPIMWKFNIGAARDQTHHILIKWWLKMEGLGAGLSGDRSLWRCGLFGFLISCKLFPKLVQEVVLLWRNRDTRGKVNNTTSNKKQWWVWPPSDDVIVRWNTHPVCWEWTWVSSH